jgi:hypothetical protein
VTRLRRRLADLFLDPRVALSAPLLLAGLAAPQMLLQTRLNPLPGGYTHYNNYVIFRQAFAHLVEGRDLYLHFPAEHFDNFLYSPTFAVLMAPLAPLPVWLGLVLWYFSQPGTPVHRALLWFAFLFVSVTYSDLVPHGFRDRHIHPYALKALPVVVIWCVAVAELTLRRGRAADPPVRSALP